MSIAAALLLLLFSCAVFATTPNSGVSVQFFSTVDETDDSCMQWPVVYDWVAGTALLGNYTGNFVPSCSEMDQIAIDSTNGRIFYYAANEPGEDNTIFTYRYRDTSDTATIPYMVNQVSTPYLHTPEALVYDPELDVLILVDLWNYTIYYLNYKTGDLDAIMTIDSSVVWACSYPVYVPATDSLYCAWSYLYQLNLTQMTMSAHQLYPPLVHESTDFLMIEGIDGDDLSTVLYIIYWNPETSMWDNMMVSTSSWTVYPFDSLNQIFGYNDTDDMMQAFQIFASFSGGIYAAQIRGGSDGMSPVYLRLYQWIDNRLIITYTSGEIPAIVEDADTTPFGPFFWDGFTFTRGAAKSKK